MITVTNNVFHLETRSSSYVFAISPKGIGEHLYYGPRLANPVRDAAALMQKRYVPRKGEVSLSEKEWEVNLNDTPLEASTEGSGDFRTPFVSVLANLNCATSLDLRYKSSETFKGIKRMDCGLPQAIGGEDECHGVRVDYEDSRADVILSLYYTVFPDADAIIRRAVLRNTGKRPLSVTSLASLQLDLFDCDYTLTLIGGPWGREHRPRSQRLSYGKIVNESRSGFTGQKANTFLLERSDRSIITGLLYSADHKAVIEVTEYGRTHVISGINNDTVRPVLAPGEAFETPEAFLILGRDRVTAQSHLYSFAENYDIVTPNIENYTLEDINNGIERVQDILDMLYTVQEKQVAKDLILRVGALEKEAPDSDELKAVHKEIKEYMQLDREGRASYVLNLLPPNVEELYATFGEVYTMLNLMKKVV